MSGPESGSSYFGNMATKVTSVSYWKAGVAAVKARMGPADDPSAPVRAFGHRLAGPMNFAPITIRAIHVWYSLGLESSHEDGLV
jgi:hypothetical protein